jgi:alpha-L-arabinofuranosidase
VVNDGPRAAATRITLTGMSSPSDGSATVLRGRRNATNSLTDPTPVTPTTSTLGRLNTTFTYTFAPNSVTVLELNR